jgi:hypothetical protein
MLIHHAGVFGPDRRAGRLFSVRPCGGAGANPGRNSITDSAPARIENDRIRPPGLTVNFM